MSHAVLLPFLFISCVLLHTRLQVSRVVLLTEDINYLYAKDGTLRRKTIAVQLGHSQTATGCIDTRFESVYQAQRITIGSTIIGDQIREIFQVASGRAAVKGVANGVNPKRVKVGNLRAVITNGPNEIGSDSDEPSAHRFRAGSRDVWVVDNWLLPSGDVQTLSLVGFYECYHGELILPQLKAVAHYLNPNSLSREELMDLDGLPRPASCKATALTPEKNRGFLLDIISRRLQVRVVVFENFGWLLVKPFLHLVELRVDGIFFRMHTEIERHLSIVDALRTPKNDKRSTQEVLKVISSHSESLSYGMRIAMHYAAGVFNGDDSFGWQALGEIAAAYGDYATPQFEDFFHNPVFMIARVNSLVGGPEMARELTELAAGKGGKLHVRLAEWLHTTPQLIEKWLEDTSYDGPLRILTDPTLKKQLKDFGKQTLPLADCPQFNVLLQRLLRHYLMLRPANANGEEWVKYYKALLAQQIGKGMAWCEVKLRSIIRARIVAGFGDALAKPTMAELKEDRKTSGDSMSRRFKMPEKPPLELPPIIQNDGEESDESGVWSEEEEEEYVDAIEEEEGEDLWAVPYREIQRRLKELGQLAVGPKDELVPRLQMALEAKDAEECEEEGEESEKGEEGEEGEEGTNDAILRKHMRRIPVEVRSRMLHLDATLWCSDEDTMAEERGTPSDTYFATNLTEHYRPGTTYIKADTLMYIEEAGTYVVDPDFANSKREADRRAHLDLLFYVDTQVLVETEGGYKGKRAWHIEHRAPAAARARALIDGAAESDESGHDDEMEE
jgi:hypothetical protein